MGCHLKGKVALFRHREKGKKRSHSLAYSNLPCEMHVMYSMGQLRTLIKCQRQFRQEMCLSFIQNWHLVQLKKSGEKVQGKNHNLYHLVLASLSLSLTSVIRCLISILSGVKRDICEDAGAELGLCVLFFTFSLELTLNVARAK